MRRLANRPELERLCRYVARPAVSSRRVSELEDGRVRLELKRPWSDGTVALTFTAEELVERLAALVPPPRAHAGVGVGALSLLRHRGGGVADGVVAEAEHAAVFEGGGEADVDAAGVGEQAQARRTRHDLLLQGLPELRGAKRRVATERPTR